MFVWSRSQSTNSNCLPYCGHYGEVSNQNWEVDKRYGVAMISLLWSRSSLQSKSDNLIIILPIVGIHPNTNDYYASFFYGVT